MAVTQKPTKKPTPRKRGSGNVVRIADGREVAGHPAAARKVNQAERRTHAIELRKAGATYQAIGDELHVTRQTAHEIVTAYMNDLQGLASSEAEMIRAIELERLDRMQLGLWTRATGGDVRAVEAVLKIMDRRARYLGLDMPATGTDGSMLEVTVRYVETFRSD